MRLHQFQLVVAFVALAGAATAIAAPPATQPAPMPDGPAELIVVNAKVWSPGRKDAADSFSVRAGRFIAVGSKSQVEARRGPNTKIIDAGGRRTLPGLIDAHLHLVSGGISLSHVSLRECRSRQEFIDVIKQRVAELRPGEWLVGRGWSTESWPDPTPLTRAWIDHHTPNNPVLLYRMDGHCALVNLAALNKAGFTRDQPPNPPGGVIDRLPDGMPTGILRESAIDLVARFVPEPKFEDRCAGALAAIREANRAGLTCVHSMGAWADVAALKKLRNDGKLSLRVALFLQDEYWPAGIRQIKTFDTPDDRLWIAGLKAYMDGSLGSRTALMSEPYDDQPTSSGVLSKTALARDRMAVNFEAAERAGLQAAVHAIGDEANRKLLDLYEELEQKTGARDRRPRVEHAQHLIPDDIPRFARLRVIASMQPYHKADDARYAERAIGRARCESSYAFRGLMEAGVHVAFGSDWPVVTLNPFQGVFVAVTGWTLTGNTWMTHQNVTLEQALTAYTAEGAYAVFRENELGRIEPGYRADFVLLQSDPFALKPEQLRDVTVAETYVGGTRVWPAE